MSTDTNQEICQACYHCIEIDDCANMDEPCEFCLDINRLIASARFKEATSAVAVAKNHSMDKASAIINALATRRDELEATLKQSGNPMSCSRHQDQSTGQRGCLDCVDAYKQSGEKD